MLMGGCWITVYNKGRNKMATKKDKVPESTYKAYQAWKEDEPTPGSTPQLECYGKSMALFEAMGKAWMEFDVVRKTEKGTVGGGRMFDYAGLQTLYAATIPALVKAGVYVHFFTVTVEPEVGCIEMRITGHGGMIIARKRYNAPGDLKQEGAAQTYLIRYMYRNVFGIPGEDADASADDIPMRSRRKVKDKFAPVDVTPRAPSTPGKKVSNKDRPDEPLPPMSELMTEAQLTDLREIKDKAVGIGAIDGEDVGNIIHNVVAARIEEVKNREITNKQAVKLIEHFRGIVRNFEAEGDK
jgi:hypothetical protein